MKEMSMNRDITVLPEVLRFIGGGQATKELSLSDSVALKEASRPRELGDYSEENLAARPNTLPVNVWRGLVDEKSVAALQETSDRLSEQTGEQLDLKLAIIGWPIQTETADPKLSTIYPLHLATSISYKGLRVRSPMFISALHLVMTSDLPDWEKGNITNHVLFGYRMGAPITIASMPARATQEIDWEWIHNKGDSEPIKEGLSPTHHYMLRASHQSMDGRFYKQGEARERNHNFYYFKPNVFLLRELYGLYNDKQFHEINRAIVETWSGNFTRYASERSKEQGAIYEIQRAEMIKMFHEMAHKRKFPQSNR